MRRDKLRGALVIAELAISLTLLAGAGLLIRSFVRLVNVPPGFNPQGVISMQAVASGPKYKDHAAAASVLRQSCGQGAKPAGCDRIWRRFGASTYAIDWMGRHADRGIRAAEGCARVAGRQAFGHAGLLPDDGDPADSGPVLYSADTDKSQPVVLVDQKMADRFWPKGDAVGKRIRQGDKEPWLTIVGVVGVVKQYGLDIDTKMVTYFPYAMWGNGEMFVTARTTGDPAALANSIVEQVHAIDGDVPVFDIATMQQRVHDSVARQRFAMTMLGAFAGFAMILAAVGVYGVMSFLVTQGTSDIAIRMALGAQRGSILSLVMQQGMGLALIGIGAGVVGALRLTRFMSGLLFGVSATDPVTFAGVSALLILTAFTACYFPARRAMRVDPMVALRYE